MVPPNAPSAEKETKRPPSREAVKASPVSAPQPVSPPGEKGATGETKPGPARQDQNPQPLDSRPFPKEFLATAGIVLLSGEQVLMPRQVVPFSQHWRLLAHGIRFVRWQLALQYQKLETADGIRSVLDPVSAVMHGSSPLASRKSYSVTVNPDGCAGFAGRYLHTGKQMTMADARQICQMMKLEEYRQEDSYPDPNPTKAIWSMLPVFYREVSDKQVGELLEISKDQVTPLRLVFNMQTQRWQWMYQLGILGEPSPVVFSERVGSAPPDPADVAMLHRKFSDLNLYRTVYIGGCGVLHSTRPLDLDATHLDEAHKVLTNVNLHVNDLMSLASSYKLQTAVFTIPNERPEARQRIKPSSPRDGGKESHGSFPDYVRRIVNGPAVAMSRWVISGQPTVIGF